MDRSTKVELFEQIRREYEHGGGTIRGIAKKLGIHRRMVREAVLSAVPAERKTPVRERPKLEPAKAFVEAILEADRKAPRKQRHTAHRIWCRIRAEMPGVQICESTIRGYVRERKIELRLVGQEVFVPQSYSWGQEAQVDWYEAYADIGEERQKAYLFCMRSMASGGAFHCAFPHARSASEIWHLKGSGPAHSSTRGKRGNFSDRQLLPWTAECFNPLLEPLQ